MPIINAVRGDGVNPALLGMGRTVMEDVVRRALKKWTKPPLYGRHEGAEIGSNPHKPGRPGHNYHRNFAANLRLCPRVAVPPGKPHSAKLGMPGLRRILEAMPRPHWPTLIRGELIRLRPRPAGCLPAVYLSPQRCNQKRVGALNPSQLLLGMEQAEWERCRCGGFASSARQAARARRLDPVTARVGGR